MVSPSDRRAAVAWATTAFRVSERRACRALMVGRSSIRYIAHGAEHRPVRERLRELAHARPAFGHKRLHVLLRREGWTLNHKTTRRLYRLEGLTLRPRRPRRRRAVSARVGGTLVTAPNQRWAMDFMHDTLASGRSIRLFTLVDVCTRECLALVAAPRFQGTDVAELLTAAGRERGALPQILQCDNGTEFTSLALDAWAHWQGVALDYSRPGKPVDNCVCEAFNGSVRRECLSQHWFASLAEAQVVLDAWRQDYNDHRPHTTLGLQPPAVYRRAGHYAPRSVRVIN
jgi:putative transposase